MICLILVAVVANMLVRIMKEGEHPFVVFQIIFMLNVEVLKNILVWSTDNEMYHCMFIQYA